MRDADDPRLGGLCGIPRVFGIAVERKLAAKT